MNRLGVFIMSIALGVGLSFASVSDEQRRTDSF
jgi:hypothetical protein